MWNTLEHVYENKIVLMASSQKLRMALDKDTDAAQRRHRYAMSKQS